METSQVNVQQLFQTAHEGGNLSNDSNSLLQGFNFGENINVGLGASMDGVASAEIILVFGLYDDSGSIRQNGNEIHIRDGHNLLVEAMKGAKVNDNIQMYAMLMNAGLLYGCSFLSYVPLMDTSNYSANGQTPLYDMSIEVLATALAKMQQANDAGIQQRVICCIVTDGQDIGSRHKASDVAKLVKDIIKTETNYVFGMGIDDGQTDFNDVFKEMGIPKDCILTPNNDPKSIRKAFQTMSQSASASAAGTAPNNGNSFGGFA